MDFGLSEQQQAIADLAQQVFRDHGDDQRIRRIFESGDVFDEELWRSLAETGLLAAIIPEADGGTGLGMSEFGSILEAQGSRLGAVPYWRHALAGLAVAQFGSDALKRQLMAGLVDGSRIASLWTGAGTNREVAATQQGNGWVLNGTADAVIADHRTSLLLVRATLPEGGSGCFAVPFDDPAIGKDAIGTDWGTTTSYENAADVHFNGFELNDDARLDCTDAGQWLALRSAQAISALQLGVVSQALTRAAAYVGERNQFGRAIGSFQAVAMRMADASIQLELLRTAQWQLGWRLDNGLPAENAALVAKYQASEAGHIIGHTAQHYHGGVGADVTYPVHRFFLWATALDLAEGGAEAQLERLGASLPDRFGNEECVGV